LCTLLLGHAFCPAEVMHDEETQHLLVLCHNKQEP
jgi:hypothetical protein